MQYNFKVYEQKYHQFYKTVVSRVEAQKRSSLVDPFLYEKPKQLNYFLYSYSYKRASYVFNSAHWDN